MINRSNWQLTKVFLQYRREVDQLSSSSTRLEETWLRYLLEWAANRPFADGPKIRPTLQEFVLTSRVDGQEGQLSPIYIKKIIGVGKRFFEWLLIHKRAYAGKITAAWLDTLKPPRLENEVKEHEAVTLDEIRAIAAAPVETLRDKRIRAAAVFWFLSGIRIGAFVTLPIKAVNLNNRAIRQWPSLGVHTKFTKKATTFLLDIPDLMSIIQDWDCLVREKIPENAYWFAALSPETGDFDANIIEVGEHHSSRATKDLKVWLTRVGLPYHSPHKFRHGHAVYGVENSKDVADLKAVSMNLMHSNLSITGGVYGILSSGELQQRIIAFGKQIGPEHKSNDDVAEQLIKLAMQLKQCK